MKILIVFFMILVCCVQVYGFQEGQVLVSEAASGVSNAGGFAQTGIPVNSQPKEVNLTDPNKITNALEQEKASNDILNAVQKSNQEREIYDIEVDIPVIKEAGNEESHETLQTGQQGNTQIVTKTCLKSGEMYTKTCRRQRIVEVKVTPEVRARHPKYCLGHWADAFGWDKEYCSGCKGGGEYIVQEKKVDIARDEWVGCEELDRLHDQDKAEILSETLGPFNETRIISGEPITKDYWETKRTYALNSKIYDHCEPLRTIGCEHQSGRCYNYIHRPDGIRICETFEETYDCSVSSTNKVQKRLNMNDFMPPLQNSVANKNMYSALSQMEAMRQLAKHMEGGAQDLRIFKGKRSACTTNFGGSFKDCCKSNGGFGTSIGLATTCSVEEKNLARDKQNNLCIFVGSRKKNSTLGMNLSKEYVYCCYPSKLGLAIQKGARAQLGKSFGSVYEPQCEGLTPDQLSQVDFSQLDLSETFADIKASAEKMTGQLRIDLAQKQQHFTKPTQVKETENNQRSNRRIDQEGVSHEIVF